MGDLRSQRVLGPEGVPGVQLRVGEVGEVLDDHVGSVVHRRDGRSNQTTDLWETSDRSVFLTRRACQASSSASERSAKSLMIMWVASSTAGTVAATRPPTYGRPQIAACS